ncbi:metalloregulator ArsR/SmtB family transcription factor [Vibrio sp. ZSDE26]|uniref:Metalloregulator ArsR/SmtB family transcription factor n=1 Tax=Vibrio amylolyticus TaxID=2847292 RepID=A0A9X1XI51_9VIBR|nr:metalloregulator ArsR/SmtB family transcription factor [Vibrio amylolyticus]MCK6263637.1 metalloregulator ArsR/SmtB family transcription factor [Vibrio amylolyticus]
MDTSIVDIDEMHSQAENAADLLRVMAHPERLMVLCQLTIGEVGVGELLRCSSLSQSAFSQHLSVLRNYGLIEARKESQQVFYSLADPRVEVLIGSIHGLFCQSDIRA